MTSPVIYLARDKWAHEPTQDFGLALNAADAMLIAEAHVLGSVSDMTRDCLDGWTEPDDQGARTLLIHPGSYWLEVVPVPLLGATTEWRVTGEPGAIRGTDARFPSYQHTWSEASVARHGEKYGDTPEKCARGFAAMVRAHANQWEDGPHVSSRVVGCSDWTVAE